MIYSPYRRGTVLAPVGGLNHLHVVCNDPVFYGYNACDSVLTVNITSIHESQPHDPACVLNQGEHPFIQHPSYVYYADAVIWKVPSVINRQQSGELIPKQDLEEEIFQRVLNGFEISDHTIKRVLKFYREFCI